LNAGAAAEERAEMTNKKKDEVFREALERLTHEEADVYLASAEGTAEHEPIKNSYYGSFFDTKYSDCACCYSEKHKAEGESSTKQGDSISTVLHCSTPSFASNN
jgi:hypothetical protein